MPAISEAIPPDTICTEELMLIKAPRSGGSGTAVSNAEDEIMRPETQTNITTLKAVTTQNGVICRLQYITTMMISRMELMENITYLPRESESFPIRGATGIPKIPVIR